MYKTPFNEKIRYIVGEDVGCISGVLWITGNYDNDNMSHTFRRREAILRVGYSFHYTNTHNVKMMVNTL